MNKLENEIVELVRLQGAKVIASNGRHVIPESFYEILDLTALAKGLEDYLDMVQADAYAQGREDAIDAMVEVELKEEKDAAV